ncbi:hypothetical protein IF1G_05875 [Cordyceps javanica]|uniref:Uncharacterized protein n=1 Tax=Cordyceps javanica TaxID=43265 RepID=A0A545UZL0_9HYPO|nr:hypothetical protein IF1G_05875 [Cordyceps javanica]
MKKTPALSSLAAKYVVRGTFAPTPHTNPSNSCQVAYVIATTSVEKGSWLGRTARQRCGCIVGAKPASERHHPNLGRGPGRLRCVEKLTCNCLEDLVTVTHIVDRTRSINVATIISQRGRCVAETPQIDNRTTNWGFPIPRFPAFFSRLLNSLQAPHGNVDFTDFAFSPSQANGLWLSMGWCFAARLGERITHAAVIGASDFMQASCCCGWLG